MIACKYEKGIIAKVWDVKPYKDFFNIKISTSQKYTTKNGEEVVNYSQWFAKCIGKSVNVIKKHSIQEGDSIFIKSLKFERPNRKLENGEYDNNTYLTIFDLEKLEPKEPSEDVYTDDDNDDLPE